MLDFLESPVEFARILALIIPVLVGFITTKWADGSVKSWTMVVLSALGGVTATVVGLDGEWAWDTFFNAWFNAFILAGIVHLSVYNKIGLRQRVDNVAPNVGIGAKQAA